MPRINTEYREDAKKKIVDAAIDVAVEQGWGNMTLDAIAQKVGVTKGAFYSYYKNSRALMQDVFLSMIRKLRDSVIENIAVESDIRVAVERLADFIFLRPKPFIPLFLQAVSGMPKDPELQKKVSDLFDENCNLISAALVRYQADGQIPPDVDLYSAAQAIMPMTMGLGMITHVMGRDPRVARETWIIAVTRILKIEDSNSKK